MKTSCMFAVAGALKTTPNDNKIEAMPGKIEMTRSEVAETEKAKDPIDVIFKTYHSTVKQILDAMKGAADGANSLAGGTLDTQAVTNAAAQAVSQTKDDAAIANTFSHDQYEALSKALVEFYTEAEGGVIGAVDKVQEGVAKELNAGRCEALWFAYTKLDRHCATESHEWHCCHFPGFDADDKKWTPLPDGEKYQFTDYNAQHPLQVCSFEDCETPLVETCQKKANAAEGITRLEAPTSLDMPNHAALMELASLSKGLKIDAPELGHGMVALLKSLDSLNQEFVQAY